MEDETSRERERAELAALADGSLAPERRRALEREVARSPRLQALLREQQQALEAVRARDERAPQRLRDAIRRPPRPRRSPVRVAAPLVAAAAAIAAVALVLLSGSEPAAPTLTTVAALAKRQPTAAVAPGGPVEAWGLTYPDLAREAGWRELGSRTDRVRDRTAQTVYYGKDGRRIAYTIVSTGTVRVPKGTRSWLREGRPWYAFELDGRNVVAWERKGHMCVVSANGLSGRALVRLITG